MAKQAENIKTYFITIPEHKFLHIRNYESIGYWDFWQKQSLIPGQDCETVCGLLDSIKGKLDDVGGDMSDAGAQVHFNAMRRKAAEHPSEAVGKEVRKLYSWSDEDKLINN